MPSKPPKPIKMSEFETRYRKWHTRLSHLKSGVRILTCGVTMYLATEPVAAVMILAIGFGFAEILGILEEII